MTNDELKKSAWVCVLNDDDTYAGLDGCWIALTDEAQVEKLDEGEHVSEVPGPHFSLQLLLEWAISNGYFENAVGKTEDDRVGGLIEQLGGKGGLVGQF